ncbi:hypothetical protein AN4004.2 [Aspergillus nidulans FGSC A4]|uniref:Lactonohydrolase, putative (AFU_orthologue AFUA_1G08990) n=1 Tax=Emericella nidulans (strain FGSC A4 / ATCC 38163 / CBS 112.46 / NRRL 194 / M139) TaxID=227321 RepID=Q5B626_EMENI|nr:hypothetical protein [Aspergillus nidulans FGSC A4]EAA59475.1 hypothetical protein AN4004.2 [Aspergillus nidulans FGSC A4]CBF74907.1 TPA: lactonohydrolase, putative (AFU_orthologue; AFUA_1G08990) [Aspergillus nidulans FGSC A4]|eukprot:XP_661608.1 hypothetical protein AN4004.2 [Aspergillus nidulans FGSC A4]
MATAILLLFFATVLSSCGSWDKRTVICVHKYASVLPGKFSRTPPINLGATGSFASAVVPADTSFASIANATFIVYDLARAQAIRGSAPTFQMMLARPWSTMKLRHMCRNWAVSSSEFFTTGIYTLDPKTNKTTPLLSTYFGYYFNGADDLAIESNGDIWFTDDDYGWLDKTSTNAPSLNPAIYRFRPSTGMVQVASTALRQPNGTRFSPSGKILYVTDTGAASGSLSVPFDEISYTLDYRARRPAPLSINAQSTRLWSGRADGLQIARNGYLVAASGYPIDIMDGTGILLVQIQAPFRVNSIAFAGKNMNELWLMGVPPSIGLG